MNEMIPPPAVFAGSLARTFEYRTTGVHQAPQIRWLFPANSSISCPVLVDQGVIYVADEKGYFSAIDAVSGNLLWSFATDVVEQMNRSSSLKGVRATYIDGTTGYVASPQTLYELDLRTGQPRSSWKIDVEVDSLFMYDHVLFLVGYGQTFRFDLSTGAFASEGIEIGPANDDCVSIYHHPNEEIDIIYGLSMVRNNGDAAFFARNLSLYGRSYPEIKMAHGEFPDDFLDIVNLERS